MIEAEIKLSKEDIFVLLESGIIEFNTYSNNDNQEPLKLIISINDEK